MRVGVISDIHGNQYALSAVLKTAQKEGIEKFLVLGNFGGNIIHGTYVILFFNHNQVIGPITY